MYVIRKEFKFEMAHRLMTSYTEVCQNIHGHGYILELFFKGSMLNEDGMIVDFKKVKDELKSYIESWDHTLVLHKDDPLNHAIGDIVKESFSLKSVAYNPTAENMSRDMYDYIKEKFPILWKVRLHETKTGYAEYFEEE